VPPLRLGRLGGSEEIVGIHLRRVEPEQQLPVELAQLLAVASQTARPESSSDFAVSDTAGPERWIERAMSAQPAPPAIRPAYFLGEDQVAERERFRIALEGVEEREQVEIVGRYRRLVEQGRAGKRAAGALGQEAELAQEAVLAEKRPAGGALRGDEPGEGCRIAPGEQAAPEDGVAGLP
jgi:hypothetical protein